jgi:DNA-binding NtrC family response regulator
MDKTNILVLADHPEILETIIRLINKNESWNGIGVNSYENAAAAFELGKFDLVLLGVGVDDAVERQVRELCKSIDQRIVCMRHYGGGSGLLHSEICHALGL